MGRRLPLHAVDDAQVLSENSAISTRLLTLHQQWKGNPERGDEQRVWVLDNVRARDIWRPRAPAPGTISAPPTR